MVRQLWRRAVLDAPLSLALPSAVDALKRVCDLNSAPRNATLTPRRLPPSRASPRTFINHHQL
jgi:hypothetical protein